MRPYAITVQAPTGAEESGSGGFHGETPDEAARLVAQMADRGWHVRVHDRERKRSYLYAVTAPGVVTLLEEGTRVTFPSKRGRSQRANAAYYVWPLARDGAPLTDEGPWGPYATLDSAKTFARIGATEGRHDRAVTSGREPLARTFTILRIYRAGSGRRDV